MPGGGCQRPAAQSHAALHGSWVGEAQLLPWKTAPHSGCGCIEPGAGGGSTERPERRASREPLDWVWQIGMQCRAPRRESSGLVRSRIDDDCWMKHGDAVEARVAQSLTGPDLRPSVCRAHISGSPDRWVESYVSSLRRGHDDRRDARLRACWDLPAGRFPRRAVFQDPSIGNAPGLSMLCARRCTVDSMGGSPDRPIE